MNNDNHKYKLLVSALKEIWKMDDIDFKNDVEDTKWRCYYSSAKWHNTTSRSKISPLPINPPETIRHCHCGTKITKNCLIRHISTNQYAVVGNVCIKRCGVVMRRRCPDCKEINHCPTLRCKDCRVMCDTCDEYHDNNLICQEQNVEVYIEPSSNINMIIKFGKHKGKDLNDLLGESDGYLQWLSYQEFVDDEMKAYIKSKLLRQTTLQFGKNKGTKISDLSDDYIQWMKNNITQPWIQFV